MFTALSAAALNKYEWFTYHGKRATKFKHQRRKNTELVIYPKSRFGIRTFRGEYRVVDLADPATVFVLSDKEVKRIVGRSKGYRGTVKGVKLTAGQGGLDRKKVESKPRAKSTPKVTTEPTEPKSRATRVHRPNGEVVEYDPKYFPQIKMPPTKAEILRLYHYFNKLHFNRELPDKITVQLSESHKLSGEALVRKQGDKTDFKMRIGKRALTDIPRICDIVIHEMIHILHFKRFFVDDDAKYQGASHGPLFLEEMHRLNSFGYRINTTEDKVHEAKLVKSEYVMLVEVQNNNYLLVHDSKPFKSKIPILLDAMRARTAHAVTMKRVLYGTTDSSYAFMGAKLTKQKTIPRSPRLGLMYGGHKYIKGILADIKVEREDSLERALSGVRPKVESAVDRCISVIQTPFMFYMKAVLIASGLVQRDWIPGNAVMEAAHSLLSQEEIDFIDHTWERAEDRHFASSNTFALMRKDLLKRRLDGEDAARYLADRYEDTYKNKDHRIDTNRFIGICIEALGDIITVPDEDFVSMMREALHRGKV